MLFAKPSLQEHTKAEGQEACKIVFAIFSSPYEFDIFSLNENNKG